MSHRIGFMQGRLSDQIGDRIQCFPWSSWREEFVIGARLGLHLMEWTLDQDRLYENPLLTSLGRAEIANLGERNSIEIPSVTCDCFMQAPFWKTIGANRVALQTDFCNVVASCGALGVSLIVIPLVDNGRIENRTQEKALVMFLRGQADFLVSHRVKVLFESDFEPIRLADFIGHFDATLFGVNYDIGNSASLGFDPDREIEAYGTRIMNVHVKDRPLGGPSVPLGEGNANFHAVFNGLTRVGYAGHFILQTARAAQSDHEGVISRYRDMTVHWLTG